MSHAARPTLRPIPAPFADPGTAAPTDTAAVPDSFPEKEFPTIRNKRRNRCLSPKTRAAQVCSGARGRKFESCLPRLMKNS